MEGAGLRIESEGLGMGDGVARRHNIQRFFYVLSIGERSKTLQYTNILLCAVYWAAWQDAAISKIFISTQYAMFAQPM